MYQPKVSANPDTDTSKMYQWYWYWYFPKNVSWYWYLILCLYHDTYHDTCLIDTPQHGFRVDILKADIISLIFLVFSYLIVMYKTFDWILA